MPTNGETAHGPARAATSRALPDEWSATGPRPAPVTPISTPPAAAPRAADRSAPDGALYTLEAPARCPECHSEIETLRVLRLLRTQVSFTSTLPRKGYVILCPECDRLLSAELSGLV